LLPRRFILDDVPVLDEKPALDPKDVRRDPVDGSSESREPPVDDHDIPIGHDHPRLVFQRRRDALDAMPQDAIEPVRRMCKWIVDETCDPAVVPPMSA
jgi:hypothetical protein